MAAASLEVLFPDKLKPLKLVWIDREVRPAKRPVRLPRKGILKH